jgi:hypothetical protein
MKLRDRLRRWLGIDDDISRTMLMMTRMDRHLTTRIDCMGLTAELIDPAIKVNLQALTKRVAALDERCALLEGISMGPGITFGLAAKAQDAAGGRGQDQSAQVQGDEVHGRSHLGGARRGPRT